MSRSRRPAPVKWSVCSIEERELPVQVMVCVLCTAIIHTIYTVWRSGIKPVTVWYDTVWHRIKRVNPNRVWLVWWVWVWWVWVWWVWWVCWVWTFSIGMAMSPCQCVNQLM